MMFSETPIVVQTCSPSLVSIRTRVTAPVPLDRVEHPHPVIDEMDCRQLREVCTDGLAQGRVQCVDGAVPLGGRHHSGVADAHPDRRLRDVAPGVAGTPGIAGAIGTPGVLGMAALVGVIVDHPERLDLEELGLPTRRPAQKELE